VLACRDQLQGARVIRHLPPACALVLILFLSTTPDARAQSLFERHIAGGTCHARTYDAAHLAKHPRQTVTHFHLRRAEPDPLRAHHPARFSVAFGFRVKGSSDLYATMAECRAKGSGAECLIEGDGGGFTLAPSGAALQVTVARMEVEGAKSFSRDLARGDNRVMLVHPSDAAACAGK
jgi:hypothetical protein